MIKLILSFLLPAFLLVPWMHEFIYKNVEALNHWYIIYPLNGLISVMFRNLMIYTFGHEVTFTVNTVTMNKTQFEEYKRNQQGHAGLLFLIFTTGVMLALAIYVEWKGYFTW